MNKKTIVVLCVALVFVMAAGAVIIAGRVWHGGRIDGQPSTPESNPEAITTIGDGQDQTAADPTEGTSDMEMGVGERGDDYEDEDTQPADTKPQVSDQPQQSTEPQETTKPQESTEPVSTDPETMTIAKYEALSEEDAEAFVNSFPTRRDFINWYNAEKAKQPTDETIGSDDNGIDLGQLTKP